MANKKVSQLTSKPSVLTTDLFPIADPSTGQLFKTTISDLGTAIGSGVSSVNTLVGAVVLDTDDIQELASPTNKWFTDTRARAALSASSPLIYNSGTGAFGIQVATGSQNGYLSSTDWTTFNSKVSGSGATGRYAIWTSAGVISDGFLQTTSNITYVEGMGLNTINGLDIEGNYGGGTGGLKLRSYDETTGKAFMEFINTSGVFRLGIEGSTGGGILPGSTAYATVLTSGLTAKNLEFGTNNTKRLTLDGTSGAATFTSSVTATNFILSGGTANTGLYFGHTDKVVLANYTVGGGIDFETNGGAITMQLSSGGVLSTTGGASFGGALSGTSATFSGVSEVLKINGGGTSTMYQTFNTTGGNYYIGISSSTGSGLLGGVSAYSMAFVTESARDIVFGTNNTARLTIASTGAATFSSSVTAGGRILTTASGNDTFGFQMYKSGTTTTIVGLYQNTTGDGLIAAYNSAGTQNVQIATNGVSYFNGGNVGIGTTSPTAFSGYTTLTIDNTSGSFTEYRQGGTNTFRVGSNESSGGFLYTQGSTPIRFGTIDTERMRITSSGDLLVGTTNSSYNASGRGVVTVSGTSQAIYGLAINGVGKGYFYHEGTHAYIENSVSGGNLYVVSGGSGGVYLASGGVAWIASSDIKLKTDLKPIEDAVNKVSTLRSVIGRYKTDEIGVRRPFLIAQDVLEVLPEAVTKDKETGNLGVSYTEVIPLLVASIKELKAELDTLKNK